MKLKCVGGPNDGEWKDCSYFKPGDQIRVAKRSENRFIYGASIDKVEDTISISHAHYMMEITCYRDNKGLTHEFKFLREVDGPSRDTIMIKLLTNSFL